MTRKKSLSDSLNASNSDLKVNFAPDLRHKIDPVERNTQQIVEEKLARFLKWEGILFDRNRRICGYEVDFFFPHRRTIIEVVHNDVQSDERKAYLAERNEALAGYRLFTLPSSVITESENGGVYIVIRMLNAEQALDSTDALHRAQRCYN
jgi:very-short-patch-repair endonuclease